MPPQSHAPSGLTINGRCRTQAFSLGYRVSPRWGCGLRMTSEKPTDISVARNSCPATLSARLATVRTDPPLFKPTDDSMCLLGIQFQTVPDAPVLLLANREESYARSATGPAVHEPSTEGKPRWFGGTDLLAGGTWLGVNDRRLIVAVTNRPKEQVAFPTRSRGRLCVDLLECADVPTARGLAVAELQRTDYAGCNLLLVSPEQAVVIEAGNVLRVHDLSPGLHLVSNGDWNSPTDARLNFARHELEHLRFTTLEHWLQAAGNLCGRRATGDHPAICLEGTDRGTVSASLITLGTTPATTRFRHAPGPPTTTPFVDVSEEFRAMLSSSG